MKKYLGIMLIALFSFSCMELDDPIGYIGMEDKIPPAFEIISPLPNQEVKDYADFVIKFKSSDYSALNFNIGNQSLYFEKIYSENTINPLYRIYLHYYNGDKEIVVSAKDVNQNLAEKSIILNIKSSVEQFTYIGGINDFCEDKSGIIWFGTGKGLFFQEGSNEIQSAIGFDLVNPSVGSIAVDSKNTLWLKYGNRNSSDTPKLIHYNGTQIIGNYRIYDGYNAQAYYFDSFVFDSNDSLWGVWLDGFFSYKDENWNIYHSAFNDRLANPVVDRNDNIIFQGAYGINYFKKGRLSKVNYPYRISHGMIKDINDHLWFVAYDDDYSKKFVLEYNGSEWIKHDYIQENDEIKSFAIDNQGSIWIASGSYIWKYTDKKVEQKFYFFNSANQIFVDSKNRIWLDQGNGVFLINND
ncbi:MAG: two-component regulator propeller domain-containing protein [bacterium]